MVQEDSVSENNTGISVWKPNKYIHAAQTIPQNTKSERRQLMKEGASQTPKTWSVDNDGVRKRARVRANLRGGTALIGGDSILNRGRLGKCTSEVRNGVSLMRSLRV